MKHYIVSCNSVCAKPTLHMVEAESRDEAIASAIKAVIPNYTMTSVKVETEGDTDIYVIYAPEDFSQDHIVETYHECDLTDDALVFRVTEMDKLQGKTFSAAKLA
jgi:hypothetical protein